MDKKMVLQGPRVRLVPYLEHHVSKYHEWMTRKDLLELTSSEPLTLEEEQANQKEWANASDKISFIILAPLRLLFMNQTEKVGHGDVLASTNCLAGEDNLAKITPLDVSNAFVMVGDCNVVDLGDSSFELNVMVAEDSFHRKGVASECLRMVMKYFVANSDAKRFVAKILTANVSSILLFEKLGFTKFREIPQFDEVHMELLKTEEMPLLESVDISPYSPEAESYVLSAVPRGVI